ncbi:MAG: PD-(D/E)XK nuclease family protein [Treponema sp.]|nr:PD-(D/E)XK nuclease family protein [Candidatus Treponema equifaecale]
MNKLSLYPEQIPEFFKSKLSDKNNVFVFPTDVVKDSWIDWIITHPKASGKDAIAYENFIAWDNFKSAFVSAHKENSQAVPSLLRKMFITDLIQKNAEKPKEERLQVIINPEDQYAKTAVSFADWIAKNLPSLHFWKQKLEKSNYGELDAEDKDYLYIYQQYRDFLEANNLFEPGWIEDITLSESKLNFIILYPELLEDFQDYVEIFEDAQNITVFTYPENTEKPVSYLYPDSRKELRHTILRIIELAESKKADYSEIAVSVPNIEVYRPYIEREFSNYNVPYVIRAGVSLTQNSAGKIFQEISDCYTNSFNFDSLRALLLDECVPWKEENKKLKENLIREGNAMRCVCSPNGEDIWIKALSSKRGRLSAAIEKGQLGKEKLEETKAELDYYEKLWEFYGKLKHFISEFFADGITFEKIALAWQGFKNYFLEKDEGFDEFANLVLGRCISELNEIIAIEKNFAECNLKINNPMEFFLQVLNSKKYTPQAKESGVSVFPYRLSSGAYFKYQFVLDASQKNLDVQYRRLTFLNGEKRNKLGLTKDDKAIRATEVFIKLYAKKIQEENGPDENFVHFSSASDSFSGFSIPHSLLFIEKNLPQLDDLDFILDEKNAVRKMGDGQNKDSKNINLKLTQNQKDSFFSWSKQSKENHEPYKVCKKMSQKIEYILKEHRGSQEDKEKIKISARGDLENFFPCPRKWILNSVLKLKEDTLDTSLMQNYDMGNLYHKILELFMGDFEGKILPYYDVLQERFYLIQPVEGVINPEPVPFGLNTENLVELALKNLPELRDAPLVKTSLLKQKGKIAAKARDFLASLLLPFGSNLRKGSDEPKNFTGIGNCTLVGAEAVLEAKDENFNYFGKIDTLLKSPENDWIIIDYKNSSAPGSAECRVDEEGLLANFQMAMYVKLAMEDNKNEIAASAFYKIKDGAAVSVIDKFTRNKAGEATESFEKFEPTLKALRTYANDFAETIENADFVPRSSKNKADRKNISLWENCALCSYSTICRTTYNVGARHLEEEESKKS